MTDLVVLAGTLLDGVEPAPQRDVALRIVDGSVVEVLPAARLGRRPAQVVDARRATIAPGFVDSHVHLAFDAGSDHAVTRAKVEQRSPTQLVAQAIANAGAALAAGVTTVRDCGDRDFLTLDLRGAFEDGLLNGPRLLTAGPPVTTTGGHLHWCGLRADDTSGIRHAVRTLAEHGVDLVKVMASGGNMTAGSNPRAPQFSLAELQALVEESHRLGRPVAAHALSIAAIERSVAAGVDTIEHCVWQGEAGPPAVDDRVLDLLVDARIPAILTFAGIARLLLPEASTAEGAERAQALAVSPTGSLAGDFAWARQMRERGAQVVVASDAGTRFTGFSGFGQTLRCAMEALDLDLPSVIPLVTSAAAAAIGLGERVGAVRPGAVADLVELDGTIDPGERRIPRVRRVWRSGTLVAADGMLRAGAGGRLEDAACTDGAPGTESTGTERTVRT